MNHRDLILWLKLVQVKGLGPVKISRILQKHTLEELGQMGEEDLRQTRGLSEAMISSWLRLRKSSDTRYEEILEECDANAIQIITLRDESYPEALKTISQPPLTLFCKGNISLLDREGVAMVGSRKSPTEILNWTSLQSRRLSEEGYVIISGGAYGTDIQAHRTAIEEGGQTIIVLGSGLLNAYPEEHRSFFSDIAHSGKGLVISEHLPQFPGSRYALLQRNRITSGLASAVLACDIRNRDSGTLVQCRLAHEQDRPLFCRKNGAGGPTSDGEAMAVAEFDAVEISEVDELIAILSDRNPPNEVRVGQTTLM